MRRAPTLSGSAPRGGRRRSFGRAEAVGKDHDETFLADRLRPEDLRHPLGEEFIGRRGARGRARGALIRQPRVAEIRGDEGELGRRLRLAQVLGQLIDRQVVGRTVADVEQGVEIDEGVEARRISARGRFVGLVGLRLDAVVGAAFVGHVLDVAAPGHVAGADLVGERQRFDRIDAARAWDQALLVELGAGRERRVDHAAAPGRGVGALAADQRDVVRKRVGIQQA